MDNFSGEELNLDRWNRRLRLRDSVDNLFSVNKSISYMYVYVYADLQIDGRRPHGRGFCVILWVLNCKWGLLVDANFFFRAHLSFKKFLKKIPQKSSNFTKKNHSIVKFVSFIAPHVYPQLLSPPFLALSSPFSNHLPYFILPLPFLPRRRVLATPSIFIWKTNLYQYRNRNSGWAHEC